MSGEVKTIKLSDSVKFSFKQNAKGFWTFAEVTVQFSPVDEEMKGIISEQIEQWMKEFENRGRVFQTPVTKPEIVTEDKVNEILT